MNEIFTRVSCRSFKNQPVEEEKIRQVLKAAMRAPSAGDQRPWEFYVVRDREKIHALGDVTAYSSSAKGAPVVIVGVMRSMVPMERFEAIDLSMAMMNIWLEATSLGLGGVFLGIAPIPSYIEGVERILNLPPDQSAFGLFPMGYPDEEKEIEDRFDESRIHWD